MEVDLSMTIGDVIVAAATVGAVVTCYFGLKHLITTVLQHARELASQVAEHNEILDDHDRSIVALEIKAFGRRREDRRQLRRQRDRFINQENQG